MRQATKEWLDGLSIGDLVADTTSYGRAYKILQIERLTPTQFVMSNSARRYRRSDGGPVGETGFGAGYGIFPLTDEIRASVERDRLLRHILATTWAELETSSLREVWAVVQRAEASD